MGGRGEKTTMKRKFIRWYSLPEGIRKRLMSKEIDYLRDFGLFFNGWDKSHGEDNAILFSVHGCLTYDVIMPRIFRIMKNNVKVAIFPRNFNTTDILFILPIEDEGGKT